MIFLVEYDRSEGKLVSLRPFESSERPLAQAAKLELELRLHRHRVEREVVLLEAESEETLRRGYRRYFEGLKAIAQSAIAELGGLPGSDLR